MGAKWHGRRAHDVRPFTGETPAPPGRLHRWYVRRLPEFSDVIDAVLGHGDRFQAEPEREATDRTKIISRFSKHIVLSVPVRAILLHSPPTLTSMSYA